MERTTVEFLIKPTEHAHLCSAQSFQPTIHEERVACFCGWYLLRFANDRSSCVHVQIECSRDFFGRLGSLIESIQQLRDPGMHRCFRRVLRDGLNYSNRQSVLSAIEIKDIFSVLATPLLFPMK